MAKNNSAKDMSWLLVMTALIFVPGVYVALTLCTALSAGFVVGAVYVARELANDQTMPIRLFVPVVLLGLGGVCGLYASLKGLIASIRSTTPFTPGLMIHLGTEKRLGQFIAPLCSKLGTRLPNWVILHAEPTAFVTNGKVHTFNGTAKGRILALGLPLFGALSVNELRAVISHEFAHFTGHDTVYSSRVLPIYKGAITAHDQMIDTMLHIESFFMRLPMLLPCFALRIYLTLFHTIDMGISRQREYRADAVAASTCGSQSFRKSLMKAEGIGRTFYDDSCMSTIRRLHPQAQPKDYLTAFRGSLKELNGLANSHCKAAMAEFHGKHDSHPGLKSRVESVPEVPERYNDPQAAISLLENPEQYEAPLSEAFLGLMANAGR
jgi:heat shock protein HtpX